MYDFATGSTDGKSDDELRNAYLISGGKAKDYDNWNSLTDADKTQMMQYIADNYEHVLKHFFQWDNHSNKPIWQHKTSILADQELYASGGSRDWDSGYVKITGLDNGKIKSIKLYDGHQEREFDFSRTNRGQFYATPYTYAVKCGPGLTLTFDTDNPNISHEQIRRGLEQRLEQMISENLLPYNTDVKEVVELIDSITAKTEFTPTTLTELDALDNDEETGFYYVPVEMTADIKTYGKQVGLRYSDFGTINGTQNLAGVKNSTDGLGYVFAGGYDIKNINKDDLSGKMAFSGRAAGNVMHHVEDKHEIKYNSI